MERFQERGRRFNGGSGPRNNRFSELNTSWRTRIWITLTYISLTIDQFGNNRGGRGSEGEHEETDREGGPTEIEKRLESLITRLGERVRAVQMGQRLSLP